MKRLLFSLFTLALFSAKAQTIDVLRFQSTTEFKTFVESNSLQGLSSINGYQAYSALKTTFAAKPTPPAGFNDEYDEPDTKNDEPAFDKTDYAQQEFLGDILNTDKVVAIGNWFIKIDLVNDRALLLNTSFSSQYADLVNNNLSNSNVLVHSLDEDGIEVLEQLDGGIAAKCNDRHVKPNNGDTKYVSSSKKFRLKMEINCQSFFFFHSLVVKSHTQKKFLGIWWHHYAGYASIPDMLLVYDARCKVGCAQYSGPPSCGGGFYQTGDICVYRPYSGWKRLSHYDFVVHFNSTNGNGFIELHDN
jgi:hypothetical protein